MNNPKYPIYVISKGRWAMCKTVKMLNRMRTPFNLVVEPQEYDEYAITVGNGNLLKLPFSNLGQGSIPARNWVWEHSIKQGDQRHWILDDNIKGICRLHENRKVQVSNSAIFKAAEDFIDRYENVALAGFNYSTFVARNPLENVKKPFVVNTRIYSCLLIRNDLKHRWRGRYNEDTDLSLEVLKDGWCTVLFNIFMIHKTQTMTMKGGNTDELYKKDEHFDGRLEMAKSLQRQHPDVVKITRKWGRWQHHVDYRPFKKNKLLKKPNIVIPDGVNNYGMVLKKIK